MAERSRASVLDRGCGVGGRGFESRSRLIFFNENGKNQEKRKNGIQEKRRVAENNSQLSEN